MASHTVSAIPHRAGGTEVLLPDSTPISILIIESASGDRISDRRDVCLFVAFYFLLLSLFLRERLRVSSCLIRYIIVMDGQKFAWQHSLASRKRTQSADLRTVN